jgi:hypothetical protein
LIDEPKAAAIVRGTAHCTPEVAREVEQRVLPQASSITVVAVRRRTGRAVIAVDPDGAAQRHRRARADRYVSRRPEPDGMASMVIHAPAPDIATIWNAVNACAEALRAPGDPRTLPARRVDALTQVCADILAGGGWAGVRLPSTDRGRPRVTVTVPYPVLLGHRAPCELTGHGPICTEQALPLIGAGDLYRILTDPVSGQLLDYGRTRYRPPPHLAEFVKIRDGECPLPSCHQDADRAPIDHIVPAKPDPRTGLPTLGSTSADNLAPPCPHHHNAKDAGRGFTLHRALDGTYTWTTPLGRIYTWKPDPLWHHDTDPIPACDCPPTCPCHHPFAATQDDDDLPPVTTGEDWADGFLTSHEPHTGVAHDSPGSEQPLDRQAPRPTYSSTTDPGPSAPPTIAPDLDDDPEDPPF